MASSLLGPTLYAAVAVALGAVALSVYLLRRQSERRGDLRRRITLLRASDPSTRVQALERVHALTPHARAALARMLHSDLVAAARAGKHPPEQGITVWFIRQILALLSDSRPAVRTDAARVLGSVMSKADSGTVLDRDESGSLAPVVTAAIELAGGRVLAASGQRRSQTRVLALAEMLESGLRPLAVGLRALEGVEEEAMEPLMAALRDRSPRVRRSLVEVLAAMGGDRAIELLLPLLKDPNPELRAQSARALGNLKATTASGSLGQLLHDSAAEVRAAAATALADLGLPETCATVLAALGEESQREDPAEQTRAAMIDAVVRLADGGRVELAESFHSLPRPVARRLTAALESSGAIGRWLGEESKERAEVRARLLAGAAELGVSQPFLEALDSTEERVRLEAAVALGHSREAAALTALAALLSDPEAGVRAAAVKAISMQSAAPAVDPLARAAGDPDPVVRLAAVSGLRAVLAQRGSWNSDLLPPDLDVRALLAAAQRALLLAAGDAQAQARAEAAHALAHFGSAEAADTLARLALQDGDEAVRRAASEAFAASAFPQKRRLLAAALEDDDESRRANATRVLAMVGGPEAGRQLADALDDASAKVREAALTALADADVGTFADLLIPQLRNPDARVRSAVAHLLGRSRVSAAVESLVQAIADPEEDVRVSALGSLAGLGRAVRRHQSAIAARRSDPSARVREAAASTLNELRAAWAELAQTTELFRHAPLSPAAAAVVADMAAAGDLDPLLRALGDPASDRQVVTYLSDSGQSRVPTFLAALHKAPEQEQSRAAAAIAGALNRGVAAGPFLSALKSIESDARLMAVEIVGKLVAPEAVEALLDVLQRDPLAEVRSRAAALLADAPGDKVKEALQRAQRDDPNNVVRRVAGRALERGTGEEERGILSPPGESSAQAEVGSSEVA